MLKLYARRERRPDKWPSAERPCTAFYYERTAERLAFIEPPDRPFRKRKTVMLNCYRWEVVWLTLDDFQSPILPTPFDGLYEDAPCARPSTRST